MPEDTTSTANAGTNLNMQSVSNEEVNKFDLEIRFAGFLPESDRTIENANTSDASSSDTTGSGTKKSPITIDESGKYIFDLTQLNIDNIVIKLESRKPSREITDKPEDREGDRA